MQVHGTQYSVDLTTCTCTVCIFNTVCITRYQVLEYSRQYMYCASEQYVRVRSIFQRTYTESFKVPFVNTIEMMPNAAFRLEKDDLQPQNETWSSKRSVNCRRLSYDNTENHAAASVLPQTRQSRLINLVKIELRTRFWRGGRKKRRRRKSGQRCSARRVVRPMKESRTRQAMQRSAQCGCRGEAVRKELKSKAQGTLRIKIISYILTSND
mgnify:CR=1 FL=1